MFLVKYFHLHIRKVQNIVHWSTPKGMRERERERERERDRETETKTDRQTGSQACRQREGETYRQTERREGKGGGRAVTVLGRAVTVHALS